MSPARDQIPGMIRPRSRRSQMIGGRVFVGGPSRSGRKQLAAVVKIPLCHSAGGLVPLRNQFATRAVFEPGRHAADDLLYSTTVSVVNVLASRPARHFGPDDPILGVVSIALSGLDDKVPGGVIEV